MKLIEPTMEYDQQIQAFRREFLESGDSMDGTSHLRKYDKTQEWLDQLEASTVQYICVREEDDKVVGMIQIRRGLNEFLQKYGGHIGYCVLSGERRKGYAKQMLSEVLPECIRLGLYDILVTCLADNEASRRTILASGGEYESTVFEPEGQRWIERYWIHFPQTIPVCRDGGTFIPQKR
jgi:predicted acetyltransferase